MNEYETVSVANFSKGQDFCPRGYISISDKGFFKFSSSIGPFSWPSAQVGSVFFRVDLVATVENSAHIARGLFHPLPLTILAWRPPTLERLSVSVAAWCGTKRGSAWLVPSTKARALSQVVMATKESRKPALSSEPARALGKQVTGLRPWTGDLFLKDSSVTARGDWLRISTFSLIKGPLVLHCLFSLLFTENTDPSIYDYTIWEG